MIKKLFLFLAFFSGIAFGDYGYVGGVWYSPTLGAVSSSATAKGGIAPGAVILPPITTPTAPSSPLNLCYTKSDGAFYCENSSAVESKIGPTNLATPSSNHIVYVSQAGGNDTTGNGSYDAPYLTLSKAYSVITTATLTDPWEIRILDGHAYNDPSPTLHIKPNVNLVAPGQGTTEIENPTVVDAVAGQDGAIQVQGLTFADTFTYDGTLSTTATLYAIQVFFGGTVTFLRDTAGAFSPNGYFQSWDSGFVGVDATAGFSYHFTPQFYGTYTVEDSPDPTDFVGADWEPSAALVVNGSTVVEISGGNKIPAVTASNTSTLKVDGGSLPVSITGTPTIVRSDDAHYLNYVPTTSANWATVPATVQAALDEVALASNTASGTKTGVLSSTDWTTFNNKQPAGAYITALTGDVTAAGPGSSAATLATVNSNVGSFTNANITVNAKGLITAAANGSAGISGSGTSGQVTVWNGSSSLTGYTGFTSDSSGNVTVNTLTATGSAPSITGNNGVISKGAGNGRYYFNNTGNYLGLDNGLVFVEGGTQWLQVDGNTGAIAAAGNSLIMHSGGGSGHVASTIQGVDGNGGANSGSDLVLKGGSLLSASTGTIGALSMQAGDSATIGTAGGDATLRAGNNTVASGTANGGDLTLQSGSTTGTSSTGNPGSVNIKTGTDVSNAKVSKINFQIADFSTVGSGTLLAPIYFAPNGPGTGADLVLHSGTTLWFNTGSQSGSNYLQGNAGNTVMTLSGTNTLNLNATSASSIIQITSTNGGGASHIYLGNASNVIGGGSSSRGQVGFANADLTVTTDNNFDAGYDGHNAARFRNIYAGTAFGLGPPSAPNILIENPETQSITINTNPSTSITDSVIIGWHAGNASMSGAEQVLIGPEVGHSLTSGTENVAMGDEVLFNGTTATYNTVIGSAAMRSATTASHNVAIGDQALRFGTTEGNNTAVGEDALNIETGNNSVGLGFFAGAYSVVGNEFYVNNFDQSNTANDKANSLLYGQFAGAQSISGQQLTVNGILKVNTGPFQPTVNNAVDVGTTSLAFAHFMAANGSFASPAYRLVADTNGAGIEWDTTNFGVAIVQNGGEIAFFRNNGTNIGMFGSGGNTSYVDFNDDGNAGNNLAIGGQGHIDFDINRSVHMTLNGGGVGGGLALRALGEGFHAREGTNGMQGVVSLVGGTATVAITGLTSSYRCFATVQVLGTVVTPQAIQCNPTAGQIAITSADGTDTSTVAYEIFTP